MALGLLVPIALVALAANSVLIRLAVVDHGADPALFAIVRVAAGAAVLMALAGATGRARPRVFTRAHWAGAGMLAGYMAGFSIAYRSLDAGFGALLLFGWVQITIFAIVVAQGARPALRRWLGAGVAMVGLVWLLWPEGRGFAGAPVDMALMSGAGICWGIYTLLGRGQGDPVAVNAANFALCLPLVLPLLVLAQGGLGPIALMLALVSGGVTSGLGYAIWYQVVARIDATTAGIGQLSVPVIATLGGLVLIGESPTLRMVLGGALVLGGIGLSLVPPRDRPRAPSIRP